MLRSWARFLFFRAGREEMGSISWRAFLGPGLVATWVVGMGRYWDHPSARRLQMFGVGSVVYVFVLGALLWAVMKLFYAFLPLLVLYLVLVVRARRQASRARRAAA